MRVLFWTMLPVPATRMPSPPLLWIVALWSVLAFPMSSTPRARLLRTEPPLRTFEEPSTRIPVPLLLIEFQLTLLLLPVMSTPCPAFSARMLFRVWPLVSTSHPTDPPEASGPTIVSLPELVMSQTGAFGLAAVTLATVHWVIFSVLDPPRTRFSVVLEKMPM